MSSSLRGKWPDGTWTPVAIASEEMSASLAVKAGTEIRLSADTVRSHLKHKVATPAAYGVLPAHLVRTGRLVRNAEGKWGITADF
ncbi:hypothetical protein ABWH89_11980 [Hoeflea alexandrii]|uniref:hypothetical protein n=1 Tax=Hoeflea alexandrii TaxID=288436 RepID=UPI0035D0ACDE